MALSSPRSAGDSATRTPATYQLVDIGANLTSGKFGRELDQVVERAKEAGVFKIMVTGSSIESSKDSLRLSRLYPNHLFSTAGVHPHEAKEWDDTCEASIEELAKNPECVAIGECGLDFNRNFSPQDVQIEVFDKQVAIACRLKKPLFVHEREASEALLKVLLKYHADLPPTVIHCFTGTRAEVKAYLDLGFYIGLTGFLWKDKTPDGVRAILEERLIPLDRLLVETDAPYMFPNIKASKVPKNIKEALTEQSLSFLNRYCSFQRNEPCSLPVTVEMIASYMKTVPQVVALSTTQNALKVFGLM
ncbi:3'-5' ssDNA/RNA exonuclease TatD [Hypsibius exemplaris]|uniref:Deoxyribonuclease TATDN1 n=1 Tax=Hypsibius exemplaris TaxID=2072580 RepID=A0A9X6RND0_HYPEX|nr:3'-5' ssDNA/RNA exonuclease TatD [Hypsibius exemplaris]